MLEITAEIGWIRVSVKTDGAYPDIADDLTNRARVLIHDLVQESFDSGWNPMVETSADELSTEEEYDG
jgi:hypothetical protein